MKRTDNQSQFDALRKEFSVFTFEKQTVKREDGRLSIVFEFNLDDRYLFHPTIEIPARPFLEWDSIPTEMLEAMAFQIGMTELVSYWKIACPKRVEIKAFSLTESQKRFWKKLYYNGLGEFLYLNGISVSEEDLMMVDSVGNQPFAKVSLPLAERTLIPVGGGKDSVVTLECLRNEMPVIPLIVNPRGATLNCVKTANFGENEFVVINRTLDPTMLKLNAEGYLNGHTPFSALLAFISVLVAFGSRSKYIALSNENSANEATVPGTNINHQYSKSIGFERDFRDYVEENLNGKVQYFSFLRPLSELQIAYLFAQFEAYHHVFRSCNVGSKTDSWCGRCPKCLFTWLVLSPFLPKEKLVAIFGKDLMADESLRPVFEELDGTASVKPFECVGTVEEVRACMEAANGHREAVENILHRFNDEHFLPGEFGRILKRRLHV
ncbi:MAG: hypothetical protein IJP44_13015 [Bacteroidales bacterium]|nr:hypothetical protein [Bacteroidales bacterium]